MYSSHSYHYPIMMMSDSVPSQQQQRQPCSNHHFTNEYKTMPSHHHQRHNQMKAPPPPPLVISPLPYCFTASSSNSFTMNHAPSSSVSRQDTTCIKTPTTMPAMAWPSSSPSSSSSSSSSSPVVSPPMSSISSPPPTSSTFHHNQSSDPLHELQSYFTNTTNTDHFHASQALSEFTFSTPTQLCMTTASHKWTLEQSYHHPQAPLGRPYACLTCPRAFARKHDLQRHIRVHTGDKPYMCLSCKKPFARTDALKRHLRMEDHCRLSPEIQAMKGAGKRRYRNL